MGQEPKLGSSIVGNGALGESDRWEQKQPWPIRVIFRAPLTKVSRALLAKSREGPRKPEIPNPKAPDL